MWWPVRRLAQREVLKFGIDINSLNLNHFNFSDPLIFPQVKGKSRSAFAADCIAIQIFMQSYTLSFNYSCLVQARPFSFFFFQKKKTKKNMPAGTKTILRYLKWGKLLAFAKATSTCIDDTSFKFSKKYINNVGE